MGNKKNNPSTGNVAPSTSGELLPTLDAEFRNHCDTTSERFEVLQETLAEVKGSIATQIQSVMQSSVAEMMEAKFAELRHLLEAAAGKQKETSPSHEVETTLGPTKITHVVSSGSMVHEVVENPPSVTTVTGAVSQTQSQAEVSQLRPDGSLKITESNGGISSNTQSLSNPPVATAGNESVKNKLKPKKEEDSESSEEQEFDGNVQVDFAFFDPKADDFHGVKTLLQTYLDDKEWDLSGFVDLILEQTTVGTVVKIEDDDDDGVFGLVTALNLGRYKELKCMKDIMEFLLEISHKDVIDDLRSILGKEPHSVALLVSQRVTNLPPQLLLLLYEALFNEISWATEDEPTVELQNSFLFTFYIIVTKFYKLRNYQQTELVMAVKADKITAFQQQLQSLIKKP